MCPASPKTCQRAARGRLAGGLAELVVEGRSGYLAEPHEPADLAQALWRAAMADADTRQRMHGHGREIHLVAGKWTSTQA